MITLEQELQEKLKATRRQALENALKPTPAETVNEVSSVKYQEVDKASKEILESISNISSGGPLEVFDNREDTGELIPLARNIDGDGVGNNRFAFNPNNNPNHVGQSLDAWETYKGEEYQNRPSTIKKLETQRRKYASQFGVPLSSVDYSHIYELGELAAEENIRNMRQGIEEGFPTIINTEGTVFQSKAKGDDRLLGRTVKNQEGLDLVQAANTQLGNANYNSKYNSRRGIPNQDLIGDEVVSDFDVLNTTSGKVRNFIAGLDDGATNVANRQVELLSDVAASVGAEILAGASDIAPKDKDTFRSIKDKEAQVDAWVEAKYSSLFKNQEKINNIAETDYETLVALSELQETPLNVDREIFLIGKGYTAIPTKDEVKQATLNKYFTPEEINFREGKGEGTKEIKPTFNGVGTGANPYGIGTLAAKKTEDDRFKTLDTERKIRAGINSLGVPLVDTALNIMTAGANPLIKPALGFLTDTALPKNIRQAEIDRVTGRAEKQQTQNRILQEQRDTDPEVLKFYNKSQELFKEGKYKEGAFEWVKGAGVSLSRHKGAAFMDVSASAAEMVALVAAPGPAILANTNSYYNESVDQFIKERGRHPTSDEAQNILVARGAQALIERIPADFILGKAAKKLGTAASGKAVGNLLGEAKQAEALKAFTALQKLIKTKTGATAGIAASIAVGSVLEGGEELVSNLLEQQATLQGTNKSFDWLQAYAGWIGGTNAGAVMEGTMQSPFVPSAIKQDLGKTLGLTAKGAVVAARAITGVVPKPSKPRQEALNNAVTNVAESRNITPEEVLTTPTTAQIQSEFDFGDIEGSLNAINTKAPSRASQKPTKGKPVSKVPTLEELSTGLDESVESLKNTDLSPEKLDVNSISAYKDSINQANQALNDYTSTVLKGNEDGTLNKKQVGEALEKIRQRKTSIAAAQTVLAQVTQADITGIKFTNIEDVGAAIGGDIITRGSAAIKDVDTSGLGEKQQGLFKRLGKLVEEVEEATNDTTTPKSYKTVLSEVLGFGSNDKGKKGLGAYLQDIGNAIAASNPKTAINALVDLNKFIASQVAKRDVITKAVKQFESDGVTTTIQAGTNKDFKINERTRNLLPTLDKEIELLKEGASLANELVADKFADKGSSLKSKETTPTVATSKESEASVAVVAEVGVTKTPEERIKRYIKSNSVLSNLLGKIIGLDKAAPSDPQGQQESEQAFEEVVNKFITHLKGKYKDLPTKIGTIHKEVKRFVKSSTAFKKKLQIDKIKNTIKDNFLLARDIYDGFGFKKVYQGYTGFFEERDINYFTLSSKEAEDYGDNVRVENLDTEKMIDGSSDTYWDLVKEDEKNTGKRFNILDSSVEGLSKQNQFFKFLKSKGYTGLDNSMYEDSQYIVTFENLEISEKQKEEAINAYVNYVKNLDTLPNTLKEIKSSIKEFTASQAKVKLKNVEPNVSESEEISIPEELLEAEKQIRLLQGKISSLRAVNPTEVDSVITEEKQAEINKLTTELNTLEAKYWNDLVEYGLRDAKAANPDITESAAKMNAEIANLQDIVDIDIDMPVRENIVKTFIKWREGVNFVRKKQTKSNEYKGKTIDSSASIRALKFIGHMVREVRPVKSLSGIIYHTTDLFGSLRQMIATKDASKEEAIAILKLEKFANELKNAIDSILPDMNDGLVESTTKPGEMVLFDDVANRSPFLNFLNKNNELNPLVKDAIVIAALDFLTAYAKQSSNQTMEDVLRTLGIDEKDNTIPPTNLSLLGSLGIIASEMENQIGKQILELLNVKQAQDNTLDPNWQGRLETSLGQLVLRSLAAMETNSYGTKVPANLLEFTAISVNDFNKLIQGMDVDIKEIDTSEGDGEGKVIFFRAPKIEGKVSTHLDILLKLAKEKPTKTVLKLIKGKRRETSGVTPLAKKFDEEKESWVRNGTTKVGKMFQSLINHLDNQEHRRTPQWDFMVKLINDGKREEWLKMHGWREPTINTKGEPSFPNEHKEIEISWLGINASLERELDDMLDFIEEWEFGLSNVEAEIADLQDKLLLTQLEWEERYGKLPKGVSYKGKVTRKLEVKINSLKKQRSNYLDKKMYLEHRMTSTGRVIETGKISPQRSTMHRYAMGFKNNIETINVKNKEQVINLVASLLEGLKLDKKEFALDSMKEFRKKIFDDRYNTIPNEVIRLAVRELQYPKGKPELITAAVAQLGEGPASLRALMAIADWSTANRPSKGTGRFLNYNVTEVDGLANGVSSGNRMIPGFIGFMDYLSESVDDMYKRVLSTLNAGGTILEGQAYKSVMEYLQENPDIYENIALLTSDEVEVLLSENKDVTLDKLTKQVNALFRKRKEATLSTSESELLDKLRKQKGLKILETSIPEFKLTNGKVTSDMRKVMKAIVMPGGYQAGDRALLNSIFNAWLTNFYTEMGRGNLDYVNEILIKAGIEPRTSENQREPLLPFEFTKLRNIHDDAIGRIAVDAFRRTNREFDENARLINSAFSIQAIIAAKVIKRKVEEKIAETGLALNDEMILELRRELQAEGIFVGFKQFGAEGNADSISVTETKKVRVDPDNGGMVSSTFKKDSLKTLEYSLLEDGSFGEPVEKTSYTATSRIKVKEVTSDIKAKGLVTAVINTDAIIAAQTIPQLQKDLGFSTIDKFDAINAPISKASKAAKILNENFNNLHENFSLWDAVQKQLNFLLDNYGTEAEAELEAFFTPYDGNTGEGNKFIPVDKNGYQVIEDIQTFMEYFNKEVSQGNQNREALNDKTVSVNQFDSYSNEGVFTVEEKKKTKEEKTSDTRISKFNEKYSRGSGVGRPTEASFDSVAEVEATPTLVKNIFNRYITRANGVLDSEAHVERLSTLMDKYVIPMLRTTEGFTIKEDTDPGRRGGFIAGTKVFIRSSDTAIRRFGTDMSDAEVLTHEFLHAIGEAGLRDNIKALSELRDLVEAAISSKQFTYKSLLQEGETSSKAIEAAKELFKYITEDPHEFFVFGLSNAVVREALERIEAPQLAPEGFIAKMLDLLSQLIERLTGHVLMRRKQAPNIAAALDQMIASFNMNAKAHEANLASRVANNPLLKKADEALDKKILEPLQKWAATSSFASPLSEIVNGGPKPTTKELLTAIVKAPINTTSEGFHTAVADMVKSAIGEKTNALTNMVKEVLDSDTVRKAYHLTLGQINEHVDTASIKATTVMKELIKEAFSRELKFSEQQILTDTLIRGDLKVFRGMDMTTLKRIVGDTQFLEDLEKQLLASLPNTVNKSKAKLLAKSLASLMIRSVPTVADGPTNAYLLARQVSSTSLYKEEIVDTLDKLKSLYAIKEMSVEERNTLVELIDAESEGIKTIIEVDFANKKEMLDTVYGGDKSRPVAGEIRTKSKTKFTSAVFHENDAADKLATGWKLVHDMPKGYGLYAKEDITFTAYQRGAFNITNDNYEGRFVKKAFYKGISDPFSRAAHIPVYRNNKIIGYRIIPDRVAREKEAGTDLGVFDAVSQETGRILRLNEGGNFNTKLLELAHADFIANVNDPKDFIELSANSPVRQIREFYTLTQSSLKDDIERIWGKGNSVYIRKDQLDLLLGYRKLSIASAINNTLDNYNKKQMSAAVTQYIDLTEEIWQGAIQEVKRRTVLFTPAVFVANNISNFALTLMMGMNPITTVADSKEGLAALRKYLKWQKELAKLDGLIKLNKGNEDTENKRKRLKKIMESSRVHFMIENGLFQSIVEDIDISDEGSIPLQKSIGKILPVELNRKATRFYEKLPANVKTGINIVNLSPSTKLGAEIQAATAYSDFVARYATMKHLERKGMSQLDALVEVKDTFVDYAPNTSRELQWINDSGLMMYTKFFLRTQRVVFKAFREHPKPFIALQLVQLLMGNIPDIADSSLAYGIPLSGGRTQTPSEVLEMLSQLPGWYLIKELF